MNNYTKGENVSFSEKTVEDVVSELFQSFPGIVQESSKVITCRNGSKLKNISNVAIQQCDTTLNYTIITGHGPAVGKVISLAEIVKRRSKSDVIQFNNIRYTLEDEHWVPKEEMQELDPLKIVRHIPFMTIFLVKSELIDDSVTLNLSNNWSKQSNLEDFLGSKTKRKDKKSKGNSSNSGNKRKFTIPKKNKDTEDNSNLAGGE